MNKRNIDNKKSRAFLSQCRQFNDIKIERIFDQIQNSPFFSFCAKKAQKDTDHF